MALTAVRSGQVDATAAQFAGTGQPLDLTASTVVVTSSLAGDYVAGFLPASIITALGISAIVQAVGACYSTANAFKGFATYDITTGRIRAYSGVTEITPANGDYYVLIVVGV